MDRLDAIRAFIRTAELGSFSAAARETGYAQSQVSRAVKALEAEFGTTLLNRSTRAVTLTAEGERAIAHVRDAMEALGRARETVRADRPTGALRVTAPIGYGHTVVAPVIQTYLARYPEATASLDLADTFVDLATSGHDLAVRIGEVEGQTLRIVGLHDCAMRLVASPEWTASRPPLADPGDLDPQCCLSFASWHTPSRWIIERRGTEEKGRGRKSIAVGGRFSSTHLPSLRSAVLAGVGIANLPAWLVDTDIESGRLVEVLPHWRPPHQPVHAVLPPGRYTPQRVKLFIELLKRAVRDTKWSSD